MSYMVRNNPGDESLKWIEFEHLEDAKLFADEMLRYGSIVKDDAGNTVYAPAGEVAAEILYNAKLVCDYVRDNEFDYGNAPINPGMNHDAKLVSCDRMVGWTFYKMGLTDQPEVMGLCVLGPSLYEWCLAHNSIKIENQKDLQPGDVVFVRANAVSGYPEHTYIFAGYSDEEDMFYRYDCGTVARIRSTQPSCEIIKDFMFATRMTKLPEV